MILKYQACLRKKFDRIQKEKKPEGICADFIADTRWRSG